MLRKIRRLASVSYRDLPFILKAYSRLISAAWVLFVLRRPAASVIIRGSVGERTIDGRGPANFNYDRAALWINRAARFPFPWARCYQRSVALCVWMESAGLKPELRLGVRKDGQKLDAHSWVEFAGRVINDSPTVRQTFTVFETSRQQDATGTTPTGLER